LREAIYMRDLRGLLKNGLVLFSDNVYLNTSYMATPFPNVSSSSKDDYIFFILRFVFESSACLEYLFPGGEF
jgi:hypothetical protein